MESLLVNERSRSANDRLVLQQSVEGQNRLINEMKNKLRDQESELDEKTRTLYDVKDELERNRATVKRLQSTENHFARWTPARVR